MVGRKQRAGANWGDRISTNYNRRSYEENNCKLRGQSRSFCRGMTSARLMLAAIAEGPMRRRTSRRSERAQRDCQPESKPGCDYVPTRNKPEVINTYGLERPYRSLVARCRLLGGMGVIQAGSDCCGIAGAFCSRWKCRPKNGRQYLPAESPKISFSRHGFLVCNREPAVTSCPNYAFP